MKRLFNRGKPDDLTTIKIILDALLGVLTAKKVITQAEVQKEILKNAKQKPSD